MSERSGPNLGQRELFEELSEGLAQHGVSAQLFVIGGAAMALAYDAGRFTRDVDAVFEPTGIVRYLTARLGARHGLQDDWINDAAKGFLPGQDQGARTVFETDNLLVQVVSVEYLLALKLYSGRSARDTDDAVNLWNRAGYTKAEQGVALLERTYPDRLLLPRHRFIVEDIATRAAAVRRNHTRHQLNEHISHQQADRHDNEPDTPGPETPPGRGSR